MKAWFTAAELAELDLPGLPRSKKGIVDYARRNEWTTRTNTDGERLSRRRAKRGGGTEFHKSLLPADALLRLSTLELKTTPEPTPPERVAEPESFTPKDALRRDARLYILSAADRHSKHNPKLGQLAADADYAMRYSRLDVPEWVRREVGEVSASSIRRWRKVRDTGDWHRLAGNYGNRRKSGVIDRAADGAAAERIAALLVAQPHLTAHHIRDLIAAEFGETVDAGGKRAPLPTVRAFERWIRAWKNENRVAYRKLTDPDGFKSTMRFTGGNMNAHVRRLNQLWEIDASPADVLTTDGRFNLYVLIDIFSRRVMVLTSRTATTEASLALIRRAILKWGVPETLRSDNGSDFVSHRFKRAMHSLAIEHDITAPFSPEQKGTVERAIGTLQRDLMPLLPGFIGHSVADRKVIEARKAFAQRLGESPDKAFCVNMSAEHLQANIDEWCEARYEHRPHRGLDGDTPFKRAASYAGTVRRVENARALDLMLAPVAGQDGYRTVTKRGISLDRAHYMHPSLMPGARVFCRCDPEDMGRIYVFEEDGGAFLCEAICPEREGVDPKVAAAAVKSAQAKIIREGTEQLRRKARAIKPGQMAEQVLRHARDKVGNVAAFPHRAEPHQTDDLFEAEIAAEAERRAPAEMTEAQQRLQEQLRDELAGTLDDKVVELPPSPERTRKQNFKRATEIREAMDRGEQVPPEDARWLGSYETTPEYRSMAAMVADFGRDWLEA